jgi:hypothetical protein
MQITNFQIKQITDVSTLEIIFGQLNFITSGVNCSIQTANVNIGAGIVQVYDKSVTIGANSVPYPLSAGEYAVALVVVTNDFGFPVVSIEFFPTAVPIYNYSTSQYTFLTFLTISTNGVSLSNVSSTGLTINRVDTQTGLSSSGAQVYTYTPSASGEVIAVNHNLNDPAPGVFVYNAQTNQLVTPASIQIINANSLTVTLSSPIYPIIKVIG